MWEEREVPVVLNLPNAVALSHVPHVVVTPNQKIYIFFLFFQKKIFLLLLYNGNFATVMNDDVNICVF